MTMTLDQFIPFLPEIFLATAGFVVLLLGVSMRRRGVRPLSLLGVAALAVTGLLVWLFARPVDGPVSILGDMLVTTGLPAERIRRIPISVLDPGTRPQPPSASRTVLLVGRLDAKKGTRELLELWRVVDHNLELRVIGDGADRSSLEEMQVPNVRFTGWMEPEELRSEMLAARALVFPSALLETFGLGMVEAFAAGVPVVANDVGTRAEVVGRDGAGWLMKDRSDWKLALTMLGDDAAVDQAGVLARQRYVERFDPEVTLPQLVQVYEELLAKQKLG